MQKLLRKGEKHLDIQDECVPTPACPKFGFFLVAVRSFCILFGISAFGAAARAVGSMSEYGKYP
jgi:hypothetical protein